MEGTNFCAASTNSLGVDIDNRYNVVPLEKSVDMKSGKHHKHKSRSKLNYHPIAPSKHLFHWSCDFLLHMLYDFIGASKCCNSSDLTTHWWGLFSNKYLGHKLIGPKRKSDSNVLQQDLIYLEIY